MELVEGMQKGVLLGTAGDYFAVVDNRTMLEQEHAVIAEITWMNSDYQRIVFAEDMENLIPGFVVENQSWVPDVLIEGCTFRNNRARGLLLTSAGDVLVRDNTFETPGAAILIEGTRTTGLNPGQPDILLLRATDSIIVHMSVPGARRLFRFRQALLSGRRIGGIISIWKYGECISVLR